VLSPCYSKERRPRSMSVVRGRSLPTSRLRGDGLIHRASKAARSEPPAEGVGEGCVRSCEFDSRHSSPAKALMKGIFRHPATFSPSPLTASWLHRPFGWLEEALAPYGGHGGAEDAGKAGSTNTDRQRTSARPLGDVGKGAGGSGTTPHRGSRDPYQDSISGLRASGGQSFGWLSTAGQLASRVRPTSFLAERSATGVRWCERGNRASGRCVAIDRGGRAADQGSLRREFSTPPDDTGTSASGLCVLGARASARPALPFGGSTPLSADRGSPPGGCVARPRRG
jgi:hypothetical protein